MVEKRTIALLVVVAAASAAIGALVARHSTATTPASGAHAAHGPTKQLWTCSMHPQVIREEPGLCPICHMALEPLKTQPDSGALTIDPVIVQNMGVRTARVASAPLERHVRAFGALRERDQDRRDVTLRVSGRVETLYANTDGMHVAKGDPLFDLWSPELSSAIEELIAARVQRDRAQDGTRGLGETLYSGAQRRLQALGLEPEQIEKLARGEHAPAVVTFTSPIDGHVIDKDVHTSATVTAGDRLMRIADNSRMWLDVRVFERDLGAIEPGEAIVARADAWPGREFKGNVSFVHPHLDERTRSALVRAEIDNPDGRLRDGMWVSTEIASPSTPDALVVPREAVIETGQRAVAFVSLGGGRFEVREVALGARGDDGLVQVLTGLEADEEVVVSGQFLLDSESRLREAVRKFLDPSKADAAHALAAKIDPAWTAKVDAVVIAYLAIARQLGALETSTASIDVHALVIAAESLANVGLDAELEPLAAELVRASRVMAGVPLDAQRDLFKGASDAMVKLVERVPPSSAVGETLFVVRCPMAPGRWLQLKSDVENPFYSTTMKSCGNVVRTIPLAGSEHK